MDVFKGLPLGFVGLGGKADESLQGQGVQRLITGDLGKAQVQKTQTGTTGKRIDVGEFAAACQLQPGELFAVSKVDQLLDSAA